MNRSLDFFQNLLRDCDLRLGGARNPHLQQVNSGILRSVRPQLTAARDSFEMKSIDEIKFTKETTLSKP